MLSLACAVLTTTFGSNQTRFLGCGVQLGQRGTGSMARGRRFCVILPVAQLGVAALFGGVGLWQRSVILSRPFFEDQTLWNSTARFHVWPWPYKFAVIANLPAFLLGFLPAWPLGVLWPNASEYVANSPFLILVPFLWSWVGVRLDRRWSVGDRAPWIVLFIFTLVCLMGAFLPIGYTGYLPYGLVVWFVMASVIRFISKPVA
jgi:hypothetical protein